MRYIRILLAWWILALTGCTLTPIQDITNSGQQLSGAVSGEVIGTGEEHQPPLTNTLTWAKNEYTLLFNNTSEEKITIYHQAWEKTKLFFINTKTWSMNAQIAFEQVWSGNLRLSQIVMPDGNMDGPFDQNTTYDLDQLWWYQLIFHENMMSGDPWSGNAIITVTLK